MIMMIPTKKYDQIDCIYSKFQQEIIYIWRE